MLKKGVLCKMDVQRNRMFLLFIIGFVFVSVTSAVSSKPTTDTQDYFYCPDNKTTCYNGQICCPYTKGGYGCCPSNSSTTSCCPGQDYCCTFLNCDSQGDGCSNISPTGWPVSWPGINLHKPANEIYSLTVSLSLKCPDGITACPANNTCCLKSDGGYNCCSSKNGICCADSTHCCPQTYYVCYDDGCYDTRTKYDVREFRSRFNSTKLSNIKTCPNGIDTCDIHHTCCSNAAEPGVSCCELPNAVCCPTKGYCCPAGTTCDEKDELCIIK